MTTAAAGARDRTPGSVRQAARWLAEPQLGPRLGPVVALMRVLVVLTQPPLPEGGAPGKTALGMLRGLAGHGLDVRAVAAERHFNVPGEVPAGLEVEVVPVEPSRRGVRGSNATADRAASSPARSRTACASSPERRRRPSRGDRDGVVRPRAPGAVGAPHPLPRPARPRSRRALAPGVPRRARAAPGRADRAPDAPAPARELAADRRRGSAATPCCRGGPRPLTLDPSALPARAARRPARRRHHRHGCVAADG